MNYLDPIKSKETIQHSSEQDVMNNSEAIVNPPAFHLNANTSRGLEHKKEQSDISQDAISESIQVGALVSGERSFSSPTYANNNPLSVAPPIFQFKTSTNHATQLKKSEEGIINDTQSLYVSHESDYGELPSNTNRSSGMQAKASPPPFQLKPDSKSKAYTAIQRKTPTSGGMPVDLLINMSQSLGADFSEVNIHRDSQSATDAGALAYTQGNDVHFAPGQYDPESASGQELIGHELTHVIQQREGRVRANNEVNGMPLNDDKGLEKEADEGGMKVTQLKSNPYVTIQRSLFGDEEHQIETKSGDPDHHFLINNPTFDQDRMRDELPGTRILNAGNPLLTDAMLTLYSNPEGQRLDDALSTVARLRGIDLRDAREQYNRALEVRAAGREFAEKNRPETGDPSPDLDLERHPDFTGSLSQLRFGSIVGDVFGMDPVFGALVSPTGGLVGPGNDSSSGDPNNPTVLHGTVHDAAGYLLNGHGVGPGYNYLKRPWELDRTDPLAGQISGTAYWANRGTDANTLSTLLTTGGVMASDYLNGRDFNYERAGVEAAIDVGRGNLVSGILQHNPFLQSSIYSQGLTSLISGGQEALSWGSGVLDGARGVATRAGGLASEAWGGLTGAAHGVADGIGDLLDGISLRDAGIGQPLTAPLGGLGGIGGIMGGMGGPLGPLGGLLGGGSLRDLGIGQPLNAPLGGLGGIGGLIGGMGGPLGPLGGLLGGGSLRDAGIGQPLTAPLGGIGGIGGLMGGMGGLLGPLGGLMGGGSLRDAGIGQPLTAPPTGSGGILGSISDVLGKAVGLFGGGSLHDAGIGQPLAAPSTGSGGVLGSIGDVLGKAIGLFGGGSLHDAGIGQPLTAPSAGPGGILGTIRDILGNIPEAGSQSANPTGHPGWDMPFDPFRIGGIGIPNDRPTHIPAGVGSQPQGDGYSTPWIYSGFNPSEDGNYPVGYQGGFGLGRLGYKDSSVTGGTFDFNLGKTPDPNGGDRYGLSTSVGAAKGTMNIMQVLNGFFPGLVDDKKNILNLDLGVGTASADAWLNPDSGFSLGAQANVAEAAITAGTTGTGDNDRTTRFGLSEGVGAGVRGLCGDRDKDGLREYGFGFDFGPFSADLKTEDPLRDFGLGMMPGVGSLLGQYVPGGNLTEGLANTLGLTTRNATIGDTADLISGLAGNAWSGAKEGVAGAWNGARGLAGDAWSGASDMAGGVYDYASEQAGNAYDKVAGFGSNLWDSVSGAAGNMYDRASGLAGSAWDFTSEKAGNAYDKVAGFGSNLWNNASGAAGNMYDRASGLAGSAWDFASEQAGNAYGKVAGLGSNLWDSASGAAGNMYDSASGLAGSAWSGAKGLAGDAVNGVSNAAGNLYNGASNVANSAWDKLTDWF